MDLTPHASDNFDIKTKIIHVRNLDCHHLAIENELSEFLISFARLINDSGFEQAHFIRA